MGKGTHHAPPTLRQHARFVADMLLFAAWAFWDLIVLPTADRVVLVGRATWRIWVGLAVGVLVGLTYRFFVLGESPSQAWHALVNLTPM